MGTTKIIMAVAFFLTVQVYGKLDLMSSEGLLSNVETIKLSYAECSEGILTADLTIVISIDSRMEVVHSFKEARAFLKRAKGKSNVMVMFPNATRMQMDETFCDQSQAEKDRALLVAVQAKLPD